jgi:exopolysaccharide production protein ExoY
MEYYSRGNARHNYVASTSIPGMYRNYMKRLFDIVFVLIIAVPLLVIVAILAAIVSLDGANPFYIQHRLGKNGRQFKMIKLRSMVPNAHAQLQDYLQNNPIARQEWEHYQKLRFDPRITRIGALIRATSLDELPQFWNVLTGEMSVVGPRPMMPDQVDLYPGSAYFRMSPGITGFWQVSCRNESSFSDRAKHDSDYYKTLSLRTDVSVIMRTVTVVVSGTGV